MVLWLSKSPANVRDGRSVLQKTCQCEGWQKRSPEDSGCEGPADTLLILMPMTLIIDYYYFKLYSTTLHHHSLLIIAINYDNCFDTERPTTPSRQQLSSTTALPPKTLIHAETRLIFAIDHYFTHCPRAYCKKLQHQYIEQKRERYIEIKIMFWEFEEEIPSHCSYTERSKL